MKTYKAIHDTWLKKSTKPASELGKGKKHFVPKDKGIKVLKTYKTANDNYYKVDLAYEAGSWLMFVPHWKLPTLNTTPPPNLEGKTFPNGVPRPPNLVNPTKTEVVEAIVNYCGRVGVTRLDQVAYVLATCEGESNFKPVREYRGKTLTRDQQRYWYTGYMG